MDFYTKMYPKAYFNNIKDVSIEFLQSHNIKGLLIDVDNTLIDYNKNILFGVKEWIDNMDKEGIMRFIKAVNRMNNISIQIFRNSIYLFCNEAIKIWI